MKKIFFLVLFTISFLISFSQGQYPITQNLGAPKTLVAVKGGIIADSSLIIPNFPDTASANKSTYINKYPGSLIRVVDSLYMRDFQSSKWIRVGVDANVTNAYVSSQQITPYTFLLSRANGSCDTINIATANMTMLISGSAVWSGTGLTYNVTNCVYYILGTLYNSSATSVTLSPADPTNPRIDVIYLDTAGNVGVLTGNPSPDPIKPVVNPISQIELTHIYISAGSVTPPNVYNKLVYNENLQVPTEWNTPSGDVQVDYAYTAFPYVGSKSAYAPQSPPETLQYQFTNDVPVNADTISFLTFYLRLRGNLTHVGKVGLYVILNNTATSENSSTVIINDGLYGFDENIINQYQLISIPMSDLVFSGIGVQLPGNNTATEFDQITIFISDEITNGCQIDYVNLQSGSAVPPIIGNYWSLSGNDVSSITSPKLGTTSNNPLSIVTNDIERINISDIGLVKVTNLQTHISQDTTTNKPVGVNANGELVKMDNWAAGEIYTENPILAIVRNDSNIIYFNPDTAAVWRSGGGGGGTGTVTSISQGYGISNSTNPITITGTISVDSATLSGKYLRINDTANLVATKSNLNLKLNISDTSNMLSPYARTNVVNAALANKLNISDTSNMLSPYARTNAVAATYVPYTGATTDVDLGTHILSGQSLAAKGTNGAGHIDLRHQASDAPSTGQTTAIFADLNGDFKWKNATNYYTTLKTSTNTADRIYTYPNATTTLIGASDTATMLTNYLRGSGASSRLPFFTDSRTLSSAANYTIGTTLTSPYLSISTTSGTATATVTPTYIFSKKSNDYSGSFIDTTTNTPYLISYNSTANKDARLYANYLSFKNLSNGSIVTINAPTSTSNRTINFTDNSGDVILSADTATMLSKYQQKYQPSYTMLVNNTSGSANQATETYKQIAEQSYTGSPTWTATTAPSGTFAAYYAWEQVGKIVTIRFNFTYSVAGSGVTIGSFPFPSDLPKPASVTGYTSASQIVAIGSGSIGTVQTVPTLTTTTPPAMALIRRNSGNTDYDIVITRVSGAYQYGYAYIQYFAQ